MQIQRLLPIPILVIWSVSLAAERSPGRLSSAAQRHTFTAVSGRLNCFCGCHGLVRDCQHIDDGCFAVQAALFLETRIVEGMTEDQILQGFVHGFGERVHSDPQLFRLEQIGRRDLIDGFVNGFGSRILYTEPSYWPIVTLIVLLSLAFLFILRVLSKRTMPGPFQRSSNSKLDPALAQRLRDLDI
ncbi:MAG: hypothetical protein K8S54_12300 [Spirochaetia bacterium]|nr:hypothetical protein [Spirochaetia bacterium]